MTDYARYLVQGSIIALEFALTNLAPGDLYRHTQITEALAALRMLDVGEG